MSSLFQRLKQGLLRTRDQFFSGLGDVFLGKKQIDEELLETLEAHLLAADVGSEATEKIIAELTEQVKRKELADASVLLARLQQLLVDLLKPSEKALVIDDRKKPFVILIVGINGAGKTTTIGKLAKHFQQQGKSVLLAAGDTFRAAAVEQLKTWGERNQIPVIAQQSGADPAAVIYDAVEAAQARGIDIVLADTAGRLHTQHNLMKELEKVVRVLKKRDPSAPHEVMIVLDGSIGQNALMQVKQFSQAVPISGITLTKLDGTAKGGILVAIAQKTGLPIRFIGVGEAIDDLQLFHAEEFIKAIFK